MQEPKELSGVSGAEVGSIVIVPNEQSHSVEYEDVGKQQIRKVKSRPKTVKLGGFGGDKSDIPNGAYYVETLDGFLWGFV